MHGHLMSELKIVSLDDYDFSNLPARNILGPEHLVGRRGLSICGFFSGFVYIDTDLGYAIAHEKTARQHSILKRNSPFYDEFDLFYDNWTGEIEADRQDDVGQTQLLSAKLPCLDEEVSWPTERGKGVTIAVLDHGIAHHSRLRHEPDDIDFCSCLLERAPRADRIPDYHGTRCAGVIAAADTDRRTSPAPDCRIVAACVVRSGDKETITFIDLLLMLSWAIHAWNAKIVNMSITIARISPIFDQPTIVRQADLLGRIAWRLRPRALIFAAAKGAGTEIAYPARVDGIIGIGQFTMTTDAPGVCAVVGSGETWKKRELLFGPGCGVATVTTPEITRDFFTESSAACAYVSGVAALYVERYLEQDDGNLDRVLRRMFQNAEPLLPNYGDMRCIAVRLPPPE